MGGWAGARLVSRAGWAAGGRGGGAPGRVIGERCGVDATAGGVRSVAVGTDTEAPWYYKAYDGFSRHVATFRGTDASPKEIYTHHEIGTGGSQLPIRREVDATGGGGWGGSSDGVLETQAFLLHRANGDVIAVVGGLIDKGGGVKRPGAVRERMEYVPGGDGAGSVEPMRLSPADGYQIGGARGADGLVTGDDYNAFIADYVAGTANSATDLNNNGVVDGDDFTAWNAEWDSGALVGRAIMSVPDGADAKGPGNVRGAMAAAGVALDAVLSGKVSGGSGQTGRVRWGGIAFVMRRLTADWPSIQPGEYLEPEQFDPAPGPPPTDTDVPVPGTETVVVRCTKINVPWFDNPLHCHVLMCMQYRTANGLIVTRCTRYGLNPRDGIPLPGISPVDIRENAPFDMLPTYRETIPSIPYPGVSACLAEATKLTSQISRPYDPFNCNSNWFVVSLMQCCLGVSPLLSSQAVGAYRCCPPVQQFDANGNPRPRAERFVCPRGAVGEGLSFYNCPVTEL